MDCTGFGWWPEERGGPDSDYLYYYDPNKIPPQAADHDKKAMRQPVGERKPQTRREKTKRKRRRKTSKASRKINRRKS